MTKRFEIKEYDLSWRSQEETGAVGIYREDGWRYCITVGSAEELSAIADILRNFPKAYYDVTSNELFTDVMKVGNKG